MTLTFISPYCQTNCNDQQTLQRPLPEVLIISDPPKNFHNLPISGEPTTRLHTSNYKPPSIEDMDDTEIVPHQPNAKLLLILWVYTDCLLSLVVIGVA